MLPEFFGATVSEATGQSSEQALYSSGASDIFVLSVGGGLLYSEGALDFGAIKKLADSISSLHASGYKFVVVVGGGILAKDFVETARMFGSNNFELDELGVFATRLNAMLFVQALADYAFSEVLTDIKKAKTIIASGKIPVFSGLIPGVTTDFVAAILAEYLNARFVNLSNVPGIFDSDPRENPKARLFRELSYVDLLKILLKKDSMPRQNLVLDAPAALVLKRSKIPALFLDGKNIENFESAIQGNSFEGTIIDSTAQNDESIAVEFEENTETKIKEEKPKRARKAARAKRKPKRKDRDDDPGMIAMGLRLH